MKSVSQLLSEIVSDNTTIDLHLLVEDDNYRSYLNDVKKSGMTFNQCVNELTNWVNRNY